jgi:hypothetical protein
MESDQESPAATASSSRLGWPTVALVAALYIACILTATYPRARFFFRNLPGHRTDPMQHLWVMRWNKLCLTEWRSPTVCPDVQYPTGAPLGNFSPLQLQSALYVPLSWLSRNDVLIYNLLWMTGFLTTGLGTFGLIWWVLRDRGCAAFGGMLAMLSGPVMMRAHGHLELMYVGAFALFLLAWLRFTDVRGWRGIALAATTYLLMSLCAAYFAVLAIFPAVLYTFWAASRQVRARDWAGLRALTVRLGAFAALVVPGMLLAFSSTIWSMRHGYTLPRTEEEFSRYGAPLWAYLVPTPSHLLGALAPYDLYAMTGRAIEHVSYLGVITLLLMTYAVVCRVRFERAGYWWATFALLVVLSCGAYWEIGAHRVFLPGGWLNTHVAPFRIIRTPGRFNLLAVVVAALIAAAGLRHLLARIPGRTGRRVVFAVLATIAVADLAIVPFPLDVVSALPPCYAEVIRRDPHAAILDAPVVNSGAPIELTAACAYWQSIHRARTTSGYSGVANVRFNDLMVSDCPLEANRMMDAHYLDDPAHESFGVIQNVDFRDHLWMYLTTHKIDFLVLHRWNGEVPSLHVFAERVQAALSYSKIFEDERATVYDVKLLRAPETPAVLCTEGWRTTSAWLGRPSRALDRVGRLVLFNPKASTALVLELEAQGFKEPRAVVLKAGAAVLARWKVGPEQSSMLASPPFRLPAGQHELSIESDGDSVPVQPREFDDAGDPRSSSLRVFRLGIRTAQRGPSRLATSTREHPAATR